MNNNLPRIEFLGLPLVSASMSELLQSVEDQIANSDKLHFLFTPNPEMYVEALRNPGFFKILKEATWLLPDGIGIIYWSRLLKREKFKARLTGVDFLEKFLKTSSRKVFLVGGAAGAASALSLRYSQIVGFCDEIFEFEETSQSFQPERLKTLAGEVERSGAECVFVGLGAVKQERLIVELGVMAEKLTAEKLSTVKLAVGVGGAIDFLVGKQLRAPKMMRRLGLEWLFRLIRNPRERFARIYRAVLVFSWLVVKNFRNKNL